jgi:predicted component of type VI protein secretion system
MYILRLFHNDRPFEQIDARMLADGELSIGRDPQADWQIADPDCALSRLHGCLKLTDGQLAYRDSSSNGSFAADGTRYPQGEFVSLQAQQRVHIGPLMLLIEQVSEAPLSDDGNGTRITLAAGIAPAAIPSEWSDSTGQAATPKPVHRDISLVEAFCEGADLDPSALSADDPEDLMRRIGEIYRQSLLGISALLAARADTKRSYEMDRTTIGAADNNPFKWAATRRLALELLFRRADGFLSGSDAVRASFEDLAQHLTGVAKGAEAAVAATVEATDPHSVERQATSRGFTFKGRTAVCWEIMLERHADRDALEAAIKRAFGDAYCQAVKANG